MDEIFQKDLENRMTNDHGIANGGGIKPGDRIGKYIVRELLGAGGQSIVFKAYDDLLDRYVAIKQVAPHLAANGDYLAKLRENLRKIAHLGQRNEAIVTIHDVLDDPRGLFYVMEFVEGHTLERVIAESAGPVESKAALLILFRLAAALHDVHAEGIVHRDIKPSNIILTEGLKPKIIDFGVAAFGNQDASMPLATTKYLAPELYSRPDADARADLYSLGFIAYEMLLGRTKFNEIFEDIVRDPHSAALRWMKWHGNEAVAAPALHQVNPAIPQSLSDIVAKLIEKDPAKRFADAEELGRAIKAQFSARFRKTAVGESRLGVGEEPTFSLPTSRTPTATGGAIPPTAGGHVPPAALSEAESLDLDGPATAPLPRAPLTPAKKAAVFIVAGLLFLGLVGGGVAWLLHVRQTSRARAMSAVQMFDQGVGQYEQGQYAEALETFTQLRNKHSGTGASTKAAVLAAMCRAHLAIEQKRWPDAQLEEQHAKDAAEAIQASNDNPALVEWTRDIKNQIDQIGQTRLSANTFWDAMDQANHRLSQATKAADFDELLRSFNQQLGAQGVGLTTAQETQVADMQRQIARRKFLFLVEQHVREGDSLLDRREYDAAESAYTRAEDMLRDETTLQTIPPEQRDTLLRQLAAKKQEVSARKYADRTRQSIREAEKAKDTAALKKALAAALELPDLSPEDRKTYQAQLLAIEVSQAVTAAQTLFDSQQYDKALEALENVKKLQPDHLGATSLRARIEKAKQRRDAIRQGDDARAKKQYDQALKLYRQAAGLSQDDGIKTKIRDTDYELHLTQADALAAEGKYDQAEVAYADAKRIKPSASAHVDTRVLLMRERQKYSEYLDKGNKALAQNQWQIAMRWFKQAREQTKDTREIDERLSETQYRKFLTGGKKALEEKNLPVARWSFKQAIQYKDTPEARKLLDQAGGEEEEK